MGTRHSDAVVGRAAALSITGTAIALHLEVSSSFASGAFVHRVSRMWAHDARLPVRSTYMSENASFSLTIWVPPKLDGSLRVIKK